MDNNLEIFIQGRWQLGHKIAEGGYGAVYTATDIFNGQQVAVKMMEIREHDRGVRGNLEQEAQALRSVHGDTSGGKHGVPRVLWSGQEEDSYVLVTDLLGPSLDDLHDYCGEKFSAKTILMIADQAVSLLQTIHRSGWLHRDIKPHNFLLGTGVDGNVLYSIDMGLSKAWAQADKDRRRNGGRRNAFIGTHDFASLNSHLGVELTYKDDLESLGYVLILMHTGSLPWSPLGDPHLWTPDEIESKKQTTTIEELCANAPAAFAEYFREIRGMGFARKGDYPKLRRIFQRGLARSGEANDSVFDWTSRMWRELYHSGPAPALPIDSDSESE